MNLRPQLVSLIFILTICSNAAAESDGYLVSFPVNNRHNSISSIPVDTPLTVLGVTKERQITTLSTGARFVRYQNGLAYVQAPKAEADKIEQFRAEGFFFISLREKPTPSPTSSVALLPLEAAPTP